MSRLLIRIKNNFFGDSVDCLFFNSNPKHVVMMIQKKNYIDAMKSGFVLIFSATLIFTVLQQYLDSKIEKIIQSPTGLDSMIWFWGFLSLLTALLFPLLQSLLCSFYLTVEFSIDKNIKLFFSRFFEMSLIEVLRSWGKSFLWFLLFIIPGLIKYSYYMLAPFVVLFSKLYQIGKVDALELSEIIFKKYWIYFSVQFFLFYFLMPVVLSTALDQYRTFNAHPFSASGTLAFETLMILFFHYLILRKVFQHLNETKDLIYVNV